MYQIDHRRQQQISGAYDISPHKDLKGWEEHIYRIFLYRVLPAAPYAAVRAQSHYAVGIRVPAAREELPALFNRPVCQSRPVRAHHPLAVGDDYHSAQLKRKVRKQRIHRQIRVCDSLLMVIYEQHTLGIPARDHCYIIELGAQLHARRIGLARIFHYIFDIRVLYQLLPLLLRGVVVLHAHDCMQSAVQHQHAAQPLLACVGIQLLLVTFAQPRPLRDIICQRHRLVQQARQTLDAVIGLIYFKPADLELGKCHRLLQRALQAPAPVICKCRPQHQPDGHKHEDEDAAGASCISFSFHCLSSRLSPCPDRARSC